MKQNSDPFVVKKAIFEYTSLTDHNNQFVQKIKTTDALSMALANELDLVCFKKGENGGLPFCKIMGFGKWKYENEKKKKKQHSQGKKVSKELKFSPVIGDHDVEHKIRQAIEFLRKGNDVMLSMWLKGRQRIYFKEAEERMNEIVALCKDHGEETSRKKTSNNITVRLVKKTVKEAK